MIDTGHWTLMLVPDSLPYIPGDTFGFIYEITNLLNNKVYIGKKQMVSKLKRPPLKGKKNKRHCNIESDWKSYSGSCNELLKDILLHGTNNFTFKIIRFCNSKWQLSYFEAKEQFDRGVLLSNCYYNGIINCRIGKKPKTA